MMVIVKDARATVARWLKYHDMELDLEYDRRECFALAIERENIDRLIESERCQFLWWHFEPTREEARERLKHYERATYARWNYGGYERVMKQRAPVHLFQIDLAGLGEYLPVEVPREVEYLFSQSAPWNDSDGGAGSIKFARAMYEQNGSLWDYKSDPDWVAW